MSSHFSANQYDTAFSPQRLQNYQVPAIHKQQPSMRSGKTKVISNDLGHIELDANRSSTSPWGLFIGTWQMERPPLKLRTKTKLVAHLSGNSRSPSKTSQQSDTGCVAVYAAPLPMQNDTPAEETDDVKLSIPAESVARPESNCSGSFRSLSPSIRSAQGSRIGSASICSVSVLSASPVNDPRNSLPNIQSPDLLSRPESRMAVSGTQSPLGSKPSTSHSRLPTPSTTSNSSMEIPTQRGTKT